MNILNRLGEKFDANAFERSGRKRVTSVLNWNGAVYLDDRDNKVDLARCYMRELVKLSCGVCIPCRIGTSVAGEILESMCNGKAQEEDIDRLKKQCEWILSASKCTVGSIGPKAVIELIDNFKDEFKQVISSGRIVNRGDYAVKTTAPCTNGCPSNLDIPNWIERVRDGRYEDALESARRDTPFAAILGRACFHPCQDNCRRKNIDESIQICLIRRFAADNEFDGGIKPGFDIKENGHRVAIIGSGPSGLSCAYYLRLMGYKPVIFESLPVLGGMMSVGIPKYRLTQEILDKEIGYIISSGIEYRLNKRLGKDFSIKDLFKDGFEAVYIAIGAHVGQEIGLPGEKDNLKGFFDGVKFLRDIALNEKVVLGKKVIIEGGGSTAMDCARSALRLGNKDVTIVYRREREQMPAVSYEVEHAIEEGINFDFLTNPVSILQENGTVKGLRCRRMKLGAPDESGRRRPVEVEGSDFDIECDSFIMAVGQVPDLDFLKDTPEIKTYKGKMIIVDDYSHMTGMPGVFAGGDVRTGPISIVDSNRDGKNAAKRIDEYVRTKTFNITDDDVFHNMLMKIGVYEKDEKIDYPDFPAGNPAAAQTQQELGKRVTNFSEVDLGFRTEDVLYEATRCMRCYLLMMVKFED